MKGIKKKFKALKDVYTEKVGYVDDIFDDMWEQFIMPLLAYKGQVVIEVYGGVADITKCPKSVEVKIIDHDDLEAEGKE